MKKVFSTGLKNYSEKVGIAFIALGILLYISYFIPGANIFDSPFNIEKCPKNEMIFGLVCVLLIFIGNTIRIIGRIGTEETVLIIDSNVEKSKFETYNHRIETQGNNILEKVDLESHFEESLMLKIKCKSCNHLNNDNDKFCSVCGNWLVKLTEIKNLDQAKEFYFAWGGSYFGMWREVPDLLNQYEAMKVPKDLESQWHREYFDALIKDVLTSLPKDLAWKFSSLCNSIDKEQYYVLEAYKVLNLIYDKIPDDQINIMFSTLIGANSAESHGGLIEKAFYLNLREVGLKFYEYSIHYLNRASQLKLTTNPFKGYLVDLINYYSIKEDKLFVNKLKIEHDNEMFNYYRDGANEDNIYSMNMLSEYYLNGIGCSKNRDEAIRWLKLAESKGSNEAKISLNKLSRKNFFDYLFRMIF